MKEKDEKVLNIWSNFTKEILNLSFKHRTPVEDVKEELNQTEGVDVREYKGEVEIVDDEKSKTENNSRVSFDDGLNQDESLKKFENYTKSPIAEKINKLK